MFFRFFNTDALLLYELVFDLLLFLPDYTNSCRLWCRLHPRIDFSNQPRFPLTVFPFTSLNSPLIIILSHTSPLFTYSSSLLKLCDEIWNSRLHVFIAASSNQMEISCASFCPNFSLMLSLETPRSPLVLKTKFYGCEECLQNMSSCYISWQHNIGIEMFNTIQFNTRGEQMSS